MTKKTTTENPALRITAHKGFQMTFANGWTISVQWGPGNYLSNRTHDFGAPKNSEMWESSDAEIAIWDASGDWHRPPTENWGDDVKGWVTPDEAAGYIAYVSSRPAKATEQGGR